MSAKKKETVKKQEPCAPLSSCRQTSSPRSHPSGLGRRAALPPTGMKRENPASWVPCSGGGQDTGSSPGPTSTFLNVLPGETWGVSWPPHELRADPTRENIHRTLPYGVCLPTPPAVAFTPLGEGPAPWSASEKSPPGKSARRGHLRWGAAGLLGAGQPLRSSLPDREREFPPSSADSPAPLGTSSCGAQLTGLQDTELKGDFLLPLPRSPWGARQEQLQPCAGLPRAPLRGGY